jgi:hypothetical protein
VGTSRWATSATTTFGIGVFLGSLEPQPANKIGTITSAIVPERLAFRPHAFLEKMFITPFPFLVFLVDFFSWTWLACLVWLASLAAVGGALLAAKRP